MVYRIGLGAHVCSERGKAIWVCGEAAQGAGGEREHARRALVTPYWLARAAARESGQRSLPQLALRGGGGTVLGSPRARRLPLDGAQPHAGRCSATAPACLCSRCASRGRRSQTRRSSSRWTRPTRRLSRGSGCANRPSWQRGERVICGAPSSRFAPGAWSWGRHAGINAGCRMTK